MASYLITSDARGIGLELTRQLLELPVSQVGKVFALTRSDPSPTLQGLISKNPERTVHILASVDNTSTVVYKRLPKMLRPILATAIGLNYWFEDSDAVV